MESLPLMCGMLSGTDGPPLRQDHLVDDVCCRSWGSGSPIATGFRIRIGRSHADPKQCHCRQGTGQKKTLHEVGTTASATGWPEPRAARAGWLSLAPYGAPDFGRIVTSMMTPSCFSACGLAAAGRVTYRR